MPAAARAAVAVAAKSRTTSPRPDERRLVLSSRASRGSKLITTSGPRYSASRARQGGAQRQRSPSTLLRAAEEPARRPERAGFQVGLAVLRASAAELCAGRAAIRQRLAPAARHRHRGNENWRRRQLRSHSMPRQPRARRRREKAVFGKLGPMVQPRCAKPGGPGSSGSGSAGQDLTATIRINFDGDAERQGATPTALRAWRRARRTHSCSNSRSTVGDLGWSVKAA